MAPGMAGPARAAAPPGEDQVSRSFAIYARVSTEEQAQHGTSLESQAERCRALAEKLGATEMRSFVDRGISGTDIARPGLQALLAAARAHEVAAVVCLDPDRLARNLSHQLIITDQLEGIGVELHFVQFERRPTPDGRLLYAIRGAIAEFEAHKIRERTRQGKQQRLREGKAVTGTQILGYAYDRRRRGFVVDVAEAAIVRAVFAMAPQMSTQAIADALNAAGLHAKGGGSFSQSAVYGILRNPTYLGQMVQLRGQGSIPVPPLVTRDAFIRAGEALTARRRRPTGHGRVYLLSGMARCALCGRAVTGNGGSRPYYACAGKRAKPPCASPYHPAAEAEAAVWAAVVTALEDAATQDAPDVEAWAERAIARDRRRIEQRRRRMVQAGAAGRLSAEDLALALEQIDGRLAALALEPARDSRQQDNAAALAYLKRADARGRREILRSLGIVVSLGPEAAEMRMVAGSAGRTAASDR